MLSEASKLCCYERICNTIVELSLYVVITGDR